MRENAKMKKGAVTDFTVSAIGACFAETTEKKQPPCVVIAYATEREVSFVFMPWKGKNVFSYADFLNAIATAEGVGNVTYVGYDGGAKDVFFCRASGGKIVDVVPRDYENNRYENGFAEVLQSQVKFSIVSSEDYVKKIGKKLSLEISAITGKPYEERSYEYALVNAYNACLLARVSEREELQLETKGKQRAKIEFRNAVSAFVEQGVLYIKPVFRQSENVVDYYETEEFTYIDGFEASGVAYKIMYANRLNDYNIMRK